MNKAATKTGKRGALTLGVLAVVAILLIGCEEKHDYSSYCPTWLGFQYTVSGEASNDPGFPTRDIYVGAGNTIHLVACQDQKGHLIHSTDYTWTLCYDTINTVTGERDHATKLYSYHTNYDGYPWGADNPAIDILLPANAEECLAGKYDTIRFVARYTYSGTGTTIENGNIEQNTSYHGRITPQSGSTGGGAAGNFYFKVVKASSTE